MSKQKEKKPEHKDYLQQRYDGYNPLEEICNHCGHSLLAHHDETGPCMRRDEMTKITCDCTGTRQKRVKPVTILEINNSNEDELPTP
jgi:ribosomal protein S27AE